MQRFNVASPQFREDTNQLQLDLEQKTRQRKMDL